MFKVNLEKSSGIAIIKFVNQPANSIGIEFSRQLLEAALECEYDNDIRAILITANGKMFSCGGDLREFSKHGKKIGMKLAELTSILNPAVSCLCRMDKPLVVAVNGVAAGAGFSLAMLGDIVIASENASFTTAYTKVGLSPDIGISYFLPRLVGLRQAQRLIYQSPMVSASEAYEMGLVTEICKDEDLESRSIRVAREMAEMPKTAISNSRHLLLRSYGTELEEHLALEARLISNASIQEESKDLISSFQS